MKKFSVILFAVLLSACAYKHQPIYNVNDPIPASAQQLPLDKIENLIIAAGIASEWKFEHVDTGHLVGEHQTEKFSAMVDVYFDEKNWRIVYKSSSNLKADTDNHTIHSHYNLWIRHLEHEITVRLADAGLAAK